MSTGPGSRDDRLLTWEQLSERLQVRIATLKKWVSQRRLPAIRLGLGKHSLIRFSPRAIDQWLEDQSIAPVNPPAPSEPASRRKAPSGKGQSFREAIRLQGGAHAQ